MFWRYFGLLTAALLWAMPAQLDAWIAQSTGCHHNGTWYADKSLVPTVEKCLNCQCNRKTLVCRLKVCPEMPMPPPRGCVVVQKRSTCCPYLSCARLDAFYKIPTKHRIIAYLDHYERESIDRVVNDNMLQRRSDDSDVDMYVCVKNGTVYKSGSAMSSSNLCTYCYCIGGSEKCVKPKCMLPVEGCKPIFVDSTCCPVRYDCSTKTSGKSSQEVRYRKTANKHFQRMSQRLQRNRGCTVGSHFYAEGQKMKSDVDRPCDVCFCIRGTRRCAPKKCSPSLKNCMPVVPKGQCCPSSYDCGSQRDYRRAQNSRQFNLFSLLFGKDGGGEEGGSDYRRTSTSTTEISVEYPHDRHPSRTAPHNRLEAESAVSASSEKSILDALREGLEFIDGNSNQMLADNLDLVALGEGSNSVAALPTAAPVVSSTTEVSFLDLLLGPSEPAQNEITGQVSERPEAVETPTTGGYNGLSWMDLLLGPDEEEGEKNVAETTPEAGETTTRLQSDYGSTNIDRMDEDFEDDDGGSGEITVPDFTTTMEPTSTWTSTQGDEDGATEDSTQTPPTTWGEAPVTEEDASTTQAALESTTEKPTVPTTITPKSTTTTAKPRSTTTTRKPTRNPVEKLHKADAIPLQDKPAIPAKKPTKPLAKEPNLLAALLDGISGMLNEERKPSVGVSNATAQPHIRPLLLPTGKPLPHFKPLPLHKQHTRINSKIANLTTDVPIVRTKPSQNATLLLHLPKTTTTQASPASSTTSSSTSKPAAIVTTTEKPVVIETNPTILESEPLENSAEPTLPPSLPNLKIIPFLPTDAVKADRNQPLYDFYHSATPQTSRIDYDLYDDANLYPSITERYPSYPDLEDGGKAEYIFKFNVEGPVSSAVSTAGKLDGQTGSTAFLKYDFAGGEGPPSKGFSPPTKTEGGFVPKEPLLIEGVVQNEEFAHEENYQVTKHIIDITTSEPMRDNTTKPIEITTPDPFKDVIRTETPPDLTSLIEDKQQQSTRLASREDDEVAAGDSAPNPTQPETTLKSGAHRPQIAASAAAPLDDALRADINTIDKILDELFGEEEVPQSAANGSAVPPFKSMPEGAIKLLTTELTSAPLALPTTSPSTTTTEPSTKTTPSRIAPSTAAPSTTRPTTKTIRTKGASSTAAPRTKSKPKPKPRPSETTLKPSATTTTTPTRTTTTPTRTTTTTRTSTSTESTPKITKPRRPPTASPSKTATRRQPSSSTTMTTTTVRATSRRTTQEPTTPRTSPTATATRQRPPLRSSNAPSTMTTTTTTTTTNPTTARPTTTTTTTTTPTTTTPTTATPTTRTTTTTVNPFLMSPFDKLPFMDASFEVRPHVAYSHVAAPPTKASTSHLLGLVHYKNSLNQFEGLEPAYESFHSGGARPSSSHMAATLTHTHTASDSAAEQPQQSPQHSREKSSASIASSSSSSVVLPTLSAPPVTTSSTTTTATTVAMATANTIQHASSNSLIDPTGILKLAGCNIYGRMYRVGRIILELSSPCLECKCTEVGVKCGPLDC